jgi:methionyl-tRNA formyltransferase
MRAQAEGPLPSAYALSAMAEERWRVALITSVAPIAVGQAETLRSLGHEPIAVITPRRKDAVHGPTSMTDAQAPSGVDIVLVRNKRSLEPLLRAYAPDLVLCWGFPWLIPQEVLDIPRLGSVNLHPALLPRLRGPLPLAWSIRLGDPTYGVTWHRMDAGFDTGAILAQAPVPAEPDDVDIWVVGPRMAQVALGLLPVVVRRIAAGDPGDPQVASGDEPYASFFDEDYAEIDWSQPAESIHRQVRAWALSLGNNPVSGPRASLDGRSVLVTRTSLTDPGTAEGTHRMEAGDGPIWILATEPLVQPAE